MKSQTVFWLGILGVLLFIVSAVLAGNEIPEYNIVSQFLSESVAAGTKNGLFYRLFGEILSGILFFFFAWNAKNFFPKNKWMFFGFFGITVFYGLGTIIVGIFPCDEGCNREWIDPTFSQIVHNISGLLTYVFVPLSMLLIGFGTKNILKYKNYSKCTVAFGVIAMYMTSRLLVNPLGEYVGLYQRILESMILFWIIITAFYVKKTG